MKKIILLTFLVLLAGCQTRSARTVKEVAYPNMYQYKPTTILVVPVINMTTAADAASLYVTTIAKPLAEAGYYVLSIPFTEQFFRTEGIVDGKQLDNVPLSRFKTLFGADAVLFITLENWDTNYSVIGGDVIVGADFNLKSTSNDQSLWQYRNTVATSTQGSGGGLLVNLIVTAIKTATTDYLGPATRVNANIIRTLPVGKYHSKHQLDGKDPLVALTPIVRAVPAQTVAEQPGAEANSAEATQK